MFKLHNPSISLRAPSSISNFKDPATSLSDTCVIGHLSLRAGDTVIAADGSSLQRSFPVPRLTAVTADRDRHLLRRQCHHEWDIKEAEAYNFCFIRYKLFFVSLTQMEHEFTLFPNCNVLAMTLENVGTCMHKLPVL